ncbi:hypothetical protein [Altererythrobacter sp. Z27]|uniref:hypothetical protein n=1 Tax=Altererythrobacter sp. Z27 TaxID=3461147 RepID=UPI004044DA43
MAETIQTYWPYLLATLAVVLAVGWFLFLSNRKTSVVTDRRDVLDEGAAPAQRNQALIDAPRSAADPATAELPKSQPATSGDDLTRIKGLGPRIATMLNEMGVARFADIARWDDAEIDRIDAQLGKFQGRIRRDAWVEQAKFLSQGDESGFVAKFGQNG